MSENPEVYGFGVFGDYISGAPKQVIGNSLPDAPGAYVAVFDAIMNGETTGDIMFLGMKKGVISFQWNEELKATLPEDVVVPLSRPSRTSRPARSTSPTSTRSARPVPRSTSTKSCSQNGPAWISKLARFTAGSLDGAMLFGYDSSIGKFF